MRAAAPPRQEWIERRERGATIAIRFMVWLALRLGRGPARLLLYPICAYYLLFSTAARKASRAYLARALDRPPSFLDLYRHYHTFGSCVLDRVFLLDDQIDQFDLHIEGEDVLIDGVRQQQGYLLFGAHLGSFEVLRAVGRRQRALKVSVLMYEDRKINAVLNAINPALTQEIISLGRPGSMMEIGRRLGEGGFVGVLADRSLNGDDQTTVPFLGTPASFPLGPFRMAVLLKAPVVLMVGLYRGGRRYDIHFEPLWDPREGSGAATAELIADAATRYVARLEHYCRSAPYNWFNFYEFWR